jgi:hypothetical protein
VYQKSVRLTALRYIISGDETESWHGRAGAYTELQDATLMFINPASLQNVVVQKVGSLVVTRLPLLLCCRVATLLEAPLSVVPLSTQEDTHVSNSVGRGVPRSSG